MNIFKTHCNQHNQTNHHQETHLYLPYSNAISISFNLGCHHPSRGIPLIQIIVDWLGDCGHQVRHLDVWDAGIQKHGGFVDNAPHKIQNKNLEKNEKFIL